MNRTLILGNGKSGSWKIRGEQLGAAIGATVAVHPRSVIGFERAVFVKRVDPRVLGLVRAAKLLIVWDVVDAWPQPHGNMWNRDSCLFWLRHQIDVINPHAIVAATHAMAFDITETLGFKGKVLSLPHHARPGLKTNPIRRVVETVGYEGGVQYLGKWERIIEKECAARGWRFVLNPPELADLDIVVALREANGYAPLHWKSNVKLANAQGSGTPFVGNREAGYSETMSGGELFADSAAELHNAFDVLSDATVRHYTSCDLRTGALPLADVAATYRRWLESL